MRLSMVIMLLLLHEICAVEIEINPISLYREISDETLGALLLSVRPSKEAVEDFTAAMDPEYSPFPIYHSIFDHRRSVTEVEDYISAWILYPHLHHITIPIWRLRSYFQVSLGRVDLDQNSKEGLDRVDSLVCKSYKWHFTDDETISNHLLISDQVQPKFSEIQKRIYANQVSKQMKLKPIEWFRFVNSNFPLMLVDHLAWNLCSYKSARLCIDHLVCSAKIISFGKIDDAAAFAGFLGQFYECTIIEFDQFFKQIATLIVEIDDRTIYWRVCLAIIGLEKLKSFEIPQLNYSLEFMTDFISELLIKSEVRVLPFKLTERMIILLGNVKILMQKFGQDSLEFQNARILDRFYCDGLGWWGDWPECIGRWRNCLPRDGTLYAKNQIIHHKYSNDSSIFNYNELLIMISQRGRRGAIYAHEFEELQINIASDFDLPTVSVAKEKFTGSPVNKQLFRTNSGIKCFGRRPRLNLECGEIQSRSSENLVAVRNVIEISKLLASLLETFLFKCFNNDSRINTRDSIFEIGLWDPIAKLIVMCLVYGDSVIERNPFRISKSSWSILYSFGSSRSHCKNRHLIVLWRFLNDYQLFDAVPLPILLRSLGFSDEV